MAERESSSKRQRINQACDQCRKRKSKCDGEQPSCATCRSLGKACSYGTPAKKRGLPTGYVRGIEALLGLFQQSLPNGEYKLRKLLREHLVTRMADSDDYLEQASDIWRSSALAKDLDQLLSSIADDGDTARPLSAVDRALVLPPIENIAGPGVPYLPTTDLFEGLEQFHDVPPPNVPDNAQEIVDCYFRTTHCWFPILERRTVLQALYHDEYDNRSGGDCEGSRLCLWAVVAYTSAAMANMPSLRASMDPDRIQAYIRLRLSVVDNPFSMGAAQALTLLALFNVGIRRLPVARLLLSQVLCMLVDIGPEDRPRLERYQHTLQGCFLLDRILSLHMCKPPLFSDEQLIELDENVLDEWEPWIPLSHDASLSPGTQPLRSISCFNLMTQFVRMLPPTHVNTYSALQLRDKIEDLGTWYSHLKKQHQLQSVTTSSPPVVLLHLTYRFGLLVVLEQAHDLGMQIMALTEDTVNWTVQLLSQCIDDDNVLVENPLTMVYASRIQSYVNHLQASETDALHRTVHVRCSRFLETFFKKSHFGNLKNTLSNITPATARFRQSSRNIRGQDEQSTTVSSLTGIEGMNTSKDAGAAVVQQSSVNQNDYLVAEPSVNSSIFEKDDFDAMFEDMASMVMPRRYDGEVADFAHNLGFLTSDLDFNSLAFHRT